MELHYEGRLLALPKYNRLEWKRIGMANTLAYYDKITITAVIGFTIQAQESAI